MEINNKNELIIRLRNRTGLSLFICRQYLERTNYDIEEALKLIYEEDKGLHPEKYLF